jgi:hypothetical protein
VYLAVSDQQLTLFGIQGERSEVDAQREMLSETGEF